MRAAKPQLPKDEIARERLEAESDGGITATVFDWLRLCGECPRFIRLPFPGERIPLRHRRSIPGHMNLGIRRFSLFRPLAGEKEYPGFLKAG
jgi:hypothetical protein